MKRAISVAVVLLLAGLAVADDRAVKLADEVVRTCGGDRWAQVKILHFTFNVAQGTNLLFSAQHFWDVTVGTDLVTWKGKTVKVNVANPAGDEDSKAAYARWVNDSYWLLAPLKLRDPGITLTHAGTQDGLEVLHASYAGVGLTPGDQYDFYIDPDAKLVRRWEYVPEPGKKISGTWDKYQRFGVLYLATDHQFGDKRIWFSEVSVESNR